MHKICVVGPMLDSRPGYLTTPGETLAQLLIKAGYPVIAVSALTNRFLRLFDILGTLWQTRGVTPSEIKSLFLNCTYQFHKITLAPPIARKLVPISWGLCLFLESLKIFNTHYLVIIRPVVTEN